MADMGKAISQKIREAIRAKLIDLGNYVDEELPDYIMVMIANKKTEEQMKDDLVLFLGTNTEKFCSWLQGVLKKLQAARDEQKERKAKDGHKKKKSKKKDDKKEKTRRTSGESKDGKHTGTKSLGGEDVFKQPPDTDTNKEGDISTQVDVKTTKESNEDVEAPVPSSQPVISLLPDTNDILDQEIQMNEEMKKATTTDSKKPQAKANTEIQSVPASPQERVKKTENLSPKISAKHTKEPSPEIVGRSSSIQTRVRTEAMPVKGSVKSRLGVPAVKRKAQIEDKPQRVLTTMSTVVRVPMVTMKRSGPGSIIGQVIEESDEEPEPAVKRVASTVKPRRRQPLPKTKQNSMALLKKAMTQAQKSTSMFPAAGQFTEPRRMIVKSTAQPGTMKIVARSIPADQEPASCKQKQAVPLLTAAIKATTRANPPAKASTTASRANPPTKASATASRVMQPTKPSVKGSHATQSKASGTVRPLGLMSRSRLEEARERDFDAHMYQRVEKETEEEVEKEVEEQEEEEEKEERKVVEDQEEEEKADVDDEEKEEVVTVSSVASQMESVDNEDDQRQIISMTEEDKSEAVVVVEPDEMEMKMVELMEEEEENLDEEEEENVEEEMPVYDTRNTTIVRPLQFETLTSLQKRKPVAQPQPQVYPVSSPMLEDSNPRFIVTMEGKKQRPVFNQAPAMPPVPAYQPTPISRLAPNPQILLNRFEPSEEMEDVQEDTFEQTQPMQYQQVVLKERSAMMEKEIPMKRVVPTEHQLVKDSLYSPPQPQIEPITFSLQESDEEHSHVEMEEKVNERCKFWPACKNGSDCPFFHPSTPCRTFPNCKFGDKCLFIHPNCKFDATCMNPTCPYTHATRTKPAPVIIHAPPIRKFAPFKPTVASTPVCKFYPNCRNANCPFLHPHPKICRYNQSCTRPGCKFQHTNTKVAARSALKWTKDQHISEHKFASKSSSSTNLPS